MSKLKNDKISVGIDLNVSEAQKKIHELDQATKRLREQNRTLNKEIASLVRTEGDHSAEIAKLDAKIKENGDAIRANQKEIASYEDELSLSTKTAAQLGKQLKNLKRELNNTSKAAEPEKYRKLEKEIKEVEKAYAKATGSSRGFLASLLSLDKVSTAVKGFFMGIGTAVTNQIIDVFKSAISTITDFTAANSKLAAILGTSREGITQLTNQAKELGRTTTATASEVTGLQTELAKLGFTQKQIEDMTPSVLKFSKAVGTDLSSAAAFAGASMRIFGKSSAEAEDVLATLAIATTKSSLDFAKLEASMSTIGPVANAYGLSLEDTTALLGTLANAGFDASSAATATRNIILNLCDVNGQLSQAMGGPVKSLDDMVAGLKRLNAEGIDLAQTLELTDKRSVAAFNSFLSGSDSIIDLRDAITNANEDFNEMSSTMTNNANAAFAGMMSAVEGLILKFGGLENIMRSLYGAVTAFVRFIGEFIEYFSIAKSVVVTLIKYIGNFVGSILNVCKAVVDFVASIKAVSVVLTTLKVLINAIVVAWVSYKAIIIASAIKTAILESAIWAKIAALKAELLATSNLKAAVKKLYTTMISNPYGLILTAVAALIGAMIELTKRSEEYDKIEQRISEEERKQNDIRNAHAEARENLASKIALEKNKLMELERVAADENTSKKERLNAIAQLNKIIPDYNAHLDEENGRYVRNKANLDKYIASMERQMKANYYKDEYETYIKQIETAKRKANKIVKEKVNRAIDVFLANYNVPEDKMTSKGMRDYAWREIERRVTAGYVTSSSANAILYRDAVSSWQEADASLSELKADLCDLEVDMHAAGISFTEMMGDAEAETEEMPKGLSQIEHTASNTIDRLKEIKKELKKLRKEDPKTDEEYDEIQERIKALKEEKKLLEGKAKTKNKNKHQQGAYNDDDLDQVTDPIDDAHQKKLLAINKQKYDLSQEEYALKKAQEMIRYSDDLTEALETLRASTDSTKTETLANITAEENKVAAQRQAAEQEVNAAMLKQRQKFYADQLNAQQVAYENQKRVMESAVSDNEIAQEAADIYLLQEHKNTLNSQLKVLQDYYDEIKNSTTIGEAQRTVILDEIAKQMHAKQTAILTDTGKWSEKLRELMTDKTSRAGIIDSFTEQRQGIEQVYSAAIKLAGEGTEEAVALENEKQRRIAALNFQQQEQMYQLQEITGVSWANEYERELAQLENYHDQGMISEKAYQKKKLELQVDNVKKYYDYYTNLSSSMFTAIQDAEIAASDAKYDVLIRQAENNGEDTTALEEEKENAKLEIQKKYADVNFAIKVSQIIADTAVSIMKAYADLGPIAGSVAAAMLTATGAAQVASAKAERDKIKNLQPSSTSSSTDTTATAERVLSSGYAEGGYTGDGDRYEVAGVVHKGEYVVPKPIMNNPRVVDAVGTIEAIRRNRLRGTADTGSNGYAEGGYTGATSSTANTELAAAVKDMKAAIESISVIKAYVSYRDIEKAGDNLSKARAPFTRNK